MKLFYRLQVVDEDEAEVQVGCIFAYSMESLLEQQHKIEDAIKDYAQLIAEEPEEDDPTKDNFAIPQDQEDELGNNGEPLPESAKDGREEDEDEEEFEDKHKD